MERGTKTALLLGSAGALALLAVYLWPKTASAAPTIAPTPTPGPLPAPSPRPAPTPAPAPKPAAPRTLYANLASSGSTVTMHERDTLMVRLPGIGWGVGGSNAVLQSVGYNEDSANGQPVSVFVYRPTQPGASQLFGTSASGESFTLNVNVQPNPPSSEPYV